MDAILLAAGSGLRAGNGQPKQFNHICGKPMIDYSIDVLQQHPMIDKLIIVLPRGHFAVMRDKFIAIPGGETRQESVMLALAHVTSINVLIHEAARPFITTELIDSLLEVKDKESVSLYTNPVDACYIPDILHTFPQKQSVSLIQLPQIFNARLLKYGHERAKHHFRSFQDDTSLVHAMTGHAPYLIEGSEYNIKVTTPKDFIIAEAICNAYFSDRKQQRYW